jgi:glutaredoxin 3
MIVKIYSTAICPYCERAKMLLEKRNIKYTEFKIDEDVKLFEEMLALSNGRRSVPQIFIDDQHIGGYDEVRGLEKENKLQDLLK